jgi:hypothetical protein
MKSAEPIYRSYREPILKNFSVNVQGQSESSEKVEPISNLLSSFLCVDPRRFNFRNPPGGGKFLSFGGPRLDIVFFII